MTTEPLHSLALGDLSDIALLNMLDEAADTEDGTASSHDVAAMIELDSEHPARNVAIRLSHLRRMGAVDYEDGRWRLTREGEQVVRASLTQAQERALERIDDAQAFDVAHRVGMRLERLTATQRAMVKREMAYAFLRINGRR
jgi:hypothetical protein